jgi:iron complex outermembrane receptor protein
MSESAGSRVRALSILATAAALPLATAHAQAPDGGGIAIEEIVVTAERREANLQDVPISVSSFSADTLQALQVDNIGDLQSLVPNLSVHVGDANNAVVYLRGVGQIDSIAFFEPGVGIYLDDVYLGRAQGAFLDVVDVDRIEVLRGPQGSLYGRNTVGGALKYVSAAPTDEFSGRVSATAGNYGRADFKATLSGPVAGDRLLGRATLAYLSRDGYSDNRFDGSDDGDQKTLFGRGVLDFQARDNVAIQLALDYTDADPDHSRTPAKATPISVLIVDPFTFGLSQEIFPADADPFSVNADFNKVEQTETMGAGLNVTWDISDALTFRSISSWRDLDYGTELDLDGTPINAFGIYYFNEQSQVSQELQLGYSDDRKSVIGGLYYFQEDGTTFDGGVFSNFLIAASGESSFRTDSYAAYGQVDYAFTDRFTGILGFRYTDEEKEYRRTIEDFDLTALAGLTIDPDTFEISYANPELLNPRSADLALGGGIGVARPVAAPDPASFDNVSLKIGMKYQLSDAAQLYATVSEGFKSGGFNGRLAEGQLEPYDEETLTSYELGLKSQWLNDRLRANAAVFHTDYEDLQVSSFEATPDGTTFLPIFTNAGEASIQGVELELTALLTDRLSVSANVGYLDTGYDEFLAGTDPDTGEVVDVSDQRSLVNSPEWGGFVGLSYDLPLASGGGFTLAADWSFRDKTYLEVNSSENLAQGAYSVYNASVAYDSADGRWRVMLGGKNLGDEEYRTHAFDLSAFPGVELGYYNPPRTYGLTGSYNF